MDTKETAEAKRERLEKAREAGEVARQKTLRLHQDTELEVAAKLVEEGGVENVTFRIFQTVEGPIAVKLVEGVAVLHKAFTHSPDGPTGKPTEGTMDAFVKPCVAYPAHEKFAEICARRPGVRFAAVRALNRLVNGEEIEESGKS